MTAKVLIEKEFEYKCPPIHVQVHPPVVQPAMKYLNQGYHPRMLLANPRASSTIFAPQYAYVGEPYVTFGIHHGQTSHQTVNPSLGHSAQIFQPMVIPPMHPPLQVPWMPMPCYSYPHGVTSQYQQPPRTQLVKIQQTVPRNHQNKRQTRRCNRKCPQHDQIPMTYA